MSVLISNGYDPPSIRLPIAILGGGRVITGHDCGVFTCMFADFLSKDTALVFNQEHINQCRERIALSIMKGKAIM